jgi:chromosome segregation ATPase
MDVSKDNLPTEPPTPPTKTSEALKANLQAVNHHLDELKMQWETEKSRLLGEKAILQDAANRLNSEIKNTKSEVKKVSEGSRMITAAKANVQNVSDYFFGITSISETLRMAMQELSKAKETIAVLEKELGSERSRLRSMVVEQERMQHEKKRVLTDMQRNETVSLSAIRN